MMQQDTNKTRRRMFEIINFVNMVSDFCMTVVMVR